jgi:N-sulfoglucosamine sulfohydrolase
MKTLALSVFCGWFLSAVLSAAESRNINSASARSGNDRPNIVFAFADDWGRYASVYGQLEPGTVNDIVKTPNFDRVAKSGVLFTRAFVNAPSCTPCRSSLLSGQYFWRTGRGAILHGAIWDSSIPAFPLLLQSQGYHIGHTAKVWSPGTPANAPMGGNKTAFNSAGNAFNTYSQNVSAAADTDQMRDQLLEEVRQNFRSFLKQRPHETPFCYWWGPTNTHRTWIKGSGAKLWNLNPDDLQGKLSKHLPDVPEVREDVADYLGEVQAFDAGLGALLNELEQTGDMANTIVIVSGDHGMPGVPAGKCNLYDLGTRVSLAIAWPEKYVANRVVDDFVCLPDLAPTILDAAGVEIPDVMTGRSLQNVLTSSSSGQVDSSRDAVIMGRERHVSQARTDFLPYPQRAIRTTDYLYVRNFRPERWPMGTAPGFGAPEETFPDAQALNDVTYAAFADMDASPTKAWVILNGINNPQYRRYFDAAFAPRPEEELFDLKSDPDQTVNVAADPRYQSVRTELSDRLLTVLRETEDPRVTEDPPRFELPPYSSEFIRPNRAVKSGKNAKP